ncbi:MAG: FAD-binding domain-containing protein [Verrucomicrobiota bacterium]
MSGKYEYKSVGIVWFKRDLRLSDHRALVNAARQHPCIIPVYLREPAIRALPDFGERHVEFIEACLSELKQELRAKGSDLLILNMDALEALQWIFSHFPFQAIYAHEETGNGATYARDKAVSAWCDERGVVFEEYSQNGVQRRLQSRDGWARIWHQRMSQPIIDEPASLPGFPKSLAEAGELISDPTAKRHHQVGGRRRAVDTLESFLLERGRAYHREMSSPLSAETSCSRLSSYLSYGCLSMREVVQTAEMRRLAIKESGSRAFPMRPISSFLSRCHWHCHFMQKLESEPEIESRCFNRACDDLRPRNANREWLNAFKLGQTGYPFLDACIRFLDAHGWINFRMRAMITSFAAYNLWIDWRDFKDWLACQFQDYEPGIHYSQLQMQSGVTGINTLRIYSVVKQAYDHDPKGVFVRRWVPELAGVPDSYLHEPWKLSIADQDKHGARLGSVYPMPIVDLPESVKHARAKFAQLRRDSRYWEEGERVKEKHASRKNQEPRPRKPRKQSGKEQLEFPLTADE